jgi:membrane associated rhomboid family serine protease
LHLDVRHIFFNMFGLYLFGEKLEKAWGSKRFLIFYLVCGVGASVLTQFTIPFNASQFAKSAEMAQYRDIVPQIIEEYKENYSALGASGALMGVLAAFAYLFPNTERFIMLIPMPIKSKYIIAIYVLLDLFGGVYPSRGDNVGHFAHLAGALVGFLLVLYWNKTNKKTFY